MSNPKELTTSAENTFACPACGSDYIRGIDPAEFFDGEGGDCGHCGADLSMALFEDGSWRVVLDERLDPEKCERCDGTGETCAACDEMCGDAHPAAPMGPCSECGGTGRPADTGTEGGVR